MSLDCKFTSKYAVAKTTKLSNSCVLLKQIKSSVQGHFISKVSNSTAIYKQLQSRGFLVNPSSKLLHQSYLKGNNHILRLYILKIDLNKLVWWCKKILLLFSLAFLARMDCGGPNELPWEEFEEAKSKSSFQSVCKTPFSYLTDVMRHFAKMDGSKVEEIESLNNSLLACEKSIRNGTLVIQFDPLVHWSLLIKWFQTALDWRIPRSCYEIGRWMLNQIMGCVSIRNFRSKSSIMKNK